MRLQLQYPSLEGSGGSSFQNLVQRLRRARPKQTLGIRRSSSGLKGKRYALSEAQFLRQLMLGS